jgi:hypothetical protein
LSFDKTSFLHCEYVYTPSKLGLRISKNTRMASDLFSEAFRTQPVFDVMAMVVFVDHGGINNSIPDLLLVLLGPKSAPMHGVKIRFGQAAGPIPFQ